MCAETTSGVTGSSGAGVFPSGVWFGAPAAGGWFGALEGVMAKLLAVVALGGGVEAQATFQAIGGRKGREARQLCKVLSLGAGGGDNDCRCFLPYSLSIRCEPSGLLRERKSSVEGGEFPANVGKRVGGGNAVHKKLCRGGVQMDGGGAWDKVQKLRNLAIKRGCFDRVHGCKKEVVGCAAFNALDESRLQGSVDAVPDGHNRGGEGGAVSLDDESALAECEALLGGRGFWCGWGGCCSGRRLCRRW